jgi:iron complex outermembrane receptor protein
VLAGVRHSEVYFHSTDYYVRPGNPDDSGNVTHHDTTPVGGLMFDASDRLHLYLSAGKGFETPTFNELSYRADGLSGLALNLKPSISRNTELGAKWLDAGRLTANLALFRADTTDELAVARNVGGRSSFQNVGEARRQGVEATLGLTLTRQFDVDFSYTYVDATFRTAYRICTTPPCATPNVLVPAGARIPGVARNQGFARLKWRSGDWNAALELQGASGVGVNDQASESAPGYVVGHVDVGHTWAPAAGRLRLFGRVENVLDKRYIGSVIVNEANGRYYETALGRNFLAGVQWQFGP